MCSIYHHCEDRLIRALKKLMRSRTVLIRQTVYAFLIYMTGLLDQHFSLIGNVGLAKQ